MLHKKNYLPVLFLAFLIPYTSNAQFFKLFSNTLPVESITASVELSNGFVTAFTESNQQQNFHKNILLVKADASGNIIWAKRYDAGTGVSVQISQMIKTKDKGLLILGAISGDNTPDAKRCVLKINGKGNLIWARKYGGDDPYLYHGIAELNDSSIVFSYQAKDFYPGIIHAGNDGKLITASWFNEIRFSSINSIIIANGAAELTVDNRYLVNINAATNTINWQRKYNTSNQFTALLSNRCTNGDIICLAGRTSGGLLNGTARIFRTKENGQLKWAKNIRIDYNTSGSQFSIFDIVTQTSLHEDRDGNIVAVVMDESTRNMMTVFNKNGNYLYNRFFINQYSMFSENGDGTYFQTSPYSMNGNKPVYSKRSLQILSDCDSTLFETITNGTDSAAALTPLSLSTGKVADKKVSITVTDVALSTQNYCALQNKLVVKKEEEFYIQAYPVPARNELRIITKKNMPFIIYDTNGKKMMESISNSITDISKLKQGIYIIEISGNGAIARRKFIKN